MMEFNTKNLTDNTKKNKFSLKRELSLQFKRIKSFGHKVIFNVGIQRLYDANISDISTFSMLMEQAHNTSKGEIYLATGVSGYFNEQVDTLGLSNIRITGQVLADIRFIQECFGNEKKYGDNGLKVLYTTLPGTTEVTYGMQPFPAGIYEDIFCFSTSHTYNVLPKVGESEVDYYCRNLISALQQKDNLSSEQKEEILIRARRIATQFCANKNRVYLIPVSNILHNKISFGDEKGLRDGTLTGEELKNKLENMDSFLELSKKELNLTDEEIKNRELFIYCLYSNANYSIGEQGIAIYGEFSNKGITYYEIERKYELMQRQARLLGYVDGDEIPDNILYNPVIKGKQ